MDNETMSEVPIEAVEAVTNEDSGDETTAESAPETKHDEGDPSQSGENTTDEFDNLPFHKHPRFLEITKNNRELLQTNKSMQERIDKLLENQESMNTVIKAMQASEDELDPAFVELIGNDDKAKNFYGFLNELVGKGVEAKMKNIEAEEQKRQQEVKAKKEQWQSVIEKQYSDIGDTKVTKDELLEIAKKYSTNGYLLHLSDAYKIWQDTKSRQADTATSEKKQAAAKASTSGDKTGSKLDKPISLDEVRRKSWDSWKITS